jgi:hypothetical protein
MTPKEKAIELHNKYCYAIRTEENDSGYWTNVIYAKNCALIAVDEILDLNLGLSNCDENNWKTEKFYKEVKEEILKL